MTINLKNELDKKLVIPVTSVFIEELDAVVKGIVSILDIQIVEELSNVIVLNRPTNAICTIVDTKYNELYKKNLVFCGIGYVWISVSVLYETIVGESSASLSDKEKMLYALALRNAIVVQHNSLENIAFPTLVEEIISYWGNNVVKFQIRMTDYQALQDEILGERFGSVDCQESTVQSALRCLAIKAAYTDFADFAESDEIRSIENPFVRIFVLAYNMVENYYWPMQSEKIAKVLNRYVDGGRKNLKDSDIESLQDYIESNDIDLVSSVGKTSWLLRFIQANSGERFPHLRMDAHTFGVYLFYELIFEKLKIEIAA